MFESLAIPFSHQVFDPVNPMLVILWSEFPAHEIRVMDIVSAGFFSIDFTIAVLVQLFEQFFHFLQVFDAESSNCLIIADVLKSERVSGIRTFVNCFHPDFFKPLHSIVLLQDVIFIDIAPLDGGCNSVKAQEIHELNNRCVMNLPNKVSNEQDVVMVIVH